jgi:drug/metabolite transporter (DMT)-like permease
MAFVGMPGDTWGIASGASILLGIYLFIYFFISYNYIFKKERNHFVSFFGLLMDLPFIFLGVISIFFTHQTIDVWGKMLAILAIFVFSFNATYRFLKNNY